MGIEELTANTGQQTAQSPLDQPRSMTGEIANADNFSRGYEILLHLGLDATNLAGLEVGDPRPGSKCKGGTVAEMMVMPEHEDVARVIRDTVREAAEDGIDANKAVFRGLRVALKRDEAGQFIQAPIDAEVLKKNSPH